MEGAYALSDGVWQQLVQAVPMKQGQARWTISDPASVWRAVNDNPETRWWSKPRCEGAQQGAQQGRAEQGREQRHSLGAFNKVESASSKRPGVLLDKVWRPLWHPRWLVGSATGRALR